MGIGSTIKRITGGLAGLRTIPNPALLIDGSENAGAVHEKHAHTPILAVTTKFDLVKLKAVSTKIHESRRPNAPNLPRL